MAIVAECAVCGKRFKADEKQAGKKAKCSQCGTIFVIGGSAAQGAGAGALPAAATRGTLQVQDSPAAAAPVSLASSAASQSPVTVPPPKNAAPPKPVSQPAMAKAQPAAAPRLAAPPITAPTVAASPIPTKVVVSRAAPAPITGPAETDSLPTPPAVADLPGHSAALAKPKRRALLYTSIAALLAIGIGAVIYLPKFLAARSNTPLAGPAKPPNINSAQTASHIIAPSLPASTPAWFTQPDAPAIPLKLADDFRLSIPAQPPLRHNPNSLIFADGPSPFFAITLLPNADRAQSSIEVWNLATSSKTAQFKLNQSLFQPSLSADGSYYAGQFYDQDARAMRVEVWSTIKGTLVSNIDTPAQAPIASEMVLGFPAQDQMLLLGDKLTLWDLGNRKMLRELELAPRSADTHAAASARYKLIAIADSKQLALVDLAQMRILGQAAIPEVILSHPRRRLALHALEFSPDGSEIALLFDNSQGTRRIAVYDVASGVLKALHSPSAPVMSGGPEFQWLSDSKGFLVSSGVLLDRDLGRQIGQIYTELPEESLGGVLSRLLSGDRALAAWDKYPNSLMIRSIGFGREQPDWFKVDIASAKAARFDQLQCVSPDFGNGSSAQSLYQVGRLTDGSQFLVVEARFTASLTERAPSLTSLRADQFVLVADGQPHLPIGTIGHDGSFSFNKPEFDLRKGDSTQRVRSIVYAVGGHEKSLALQIASTSYPLPVPAQVTPPAPRTLSGVGWEQLSPFIYNAPDDSGQISVRITAARIRPFELDPEAAGAVPLRVTYSPGEGASLLEVTFEMTVNTARSFSRSTQPHPKPPRLGLLFPDGKNLMPAVELPDALPVTLGAGERRIHTCLFLFDSNLRKFRLTYDGAPVATIIADSSTAQSTP